MIGSNPLNPADAAVMKERGQLGQGMTVGQWLQQLGISVDDPVQEAVQKIRQKVSGASAMGKMQQMAQGGGPQGPSPQPSPAAPRPRSFQDEIRSY